MDGGSSLNLLYQDTVHKMGIDPSRIKPTKTILKGEVPGVEAHCTGSITLEVIFGSPNNFRSEGLTFDVARFHSGYDALLGHTAFARFNAVPLYAFAKLKMPGPHGVITINGNTEHSLRTTDRTTAIQPKYKAAPLSRTTHRPLSLRSLLNGTDLSQSWISSSASVVRLTITRSLYHACIIMYLKYPSHRRRHNTGKPTSTPISSLSFLTIFFLFYHR